MSKYKFIVFDLDGTVMDSVLDIVYTLNSSLKAINIDYTFSRDEGVKLLGNGAVELAKKAFEILNLDCESPLFSQFLDVYYVKYMENQGKYGKLYEGVLELFDELDKQNIKYAVFSNKPQIVIMDSIRNYMDPDRFTFVLGQKEGYAPKPDTKAINEMIKLHKIPLDAMLYVGDSDVDIILAKRLGVDSCGCVYGYRSREELAATGATYLIEKPIDLLKVIK